MDIQFKPLSQIDLSDSFFNTLKQDYAEFEKWFQRKQQDNSKAFIMESDTGLEAFLYLKLEDGPVENIEPNLPTSKRLKIGTFKVNPHGTRLGERFIKKIFDYCIRYKLKEAYVTIFPKHVYLLRLLKRYGFDQVGTKDSHNGQEIVLLKKFTEFADDILKDYPLFNINGVNKYQLAIFPEYHTRLFPDSILNNEHFDIIQDVSHTNSIHKIYICSMPIGILQPKDLLVIYRTGDKQAAAYYRAVVTSVCVVEEVRRGSSFEDVAQFLAYCQTYSVFSEEELSQWYEKGNVFVIKLTYNAAFSRRVNRKALIEEIGLNPDVRWGFIKLTDQEFNHILNRGEINESLIVNKT